MKTDQQILVLTEEETLALNSPYQSYWYCYSNKDANIKAHEKIIIDSKDPEYCYGFARYISEENLKEIQNVIVNSKNAQYCYFFALDIEDSDKQLLSEVVLKSRDVYWIQEFYKHINFDKTKYETLMLFI
jgi:hypothetical protein